MSTLKLRGGGCECSKPEVERDARPILVKTERERSPVTLGTKTAPTSDTIKQLAEIRAAPETAATLNTLSQLDDQLVERLRAGDIRLVRPAWLINAPTERIVRRQRLEELESEGESPLLSPSEAAELVRRCTRGMGALSYGWALAGDPDPAGERLALLRRTLAAHPHIEGLFWDFASLYQKPRSQEQEEAFGRGLEVMGDLYASAVGSTVLQLKEIPPRPAEYDGKLALFGVGADEGLHESLPPGARCEKVGGMTVVSFPTHEEALAFKGSSAWEALCEGIDTLYNERPYDERGWCVLPRLTTV